MQQSSPTPKLSHVTHMHPIALALGFGIAGLVVVLLFEVGIGSTWSMMGGTGGGWMHGATGGPGFGGGSMMGGAYGFFFFVLIWGFIVAAIAGGITAWVYNAAMRRNT